MDIPVLGNVRVVEDEASIGWSKSLKNLPLFTVRNIAQHRELSGKGKGLSIMKTLQRGRKFQVEGYVKNNTMFSRTSDNLFEIKCKCQASMKQELRNVYVALRNRTGKVDFAHCDCPAGKSGYCNHVMALLIQLAKYSLSGIEKIPDEVACASTARQWGVPGNKEVPKAPLIPGWVLV